MSVKIYVNEDNTATFICPECQKTVVKNLTRYIQQKKACRLKARCSCGHAYTVFLEKRKKFRKQANLPGTYRFSTLNSGTEEQIGSMAVKNISYTGLRIKLQVMPQFKVGDTLFVEFRLDDANRSQIKKKVVVKNMEGLSAGLAYSAPQNHDSVLGFYLFS